MEETKERRKRKRYWISGYSLWRLLAYFVIYSVIGYIIETLYCIIQDGVLESRQSFLYGPFCAIYGLGAVVITISLQSFKKKHTTLFFAGCIVGSLTEYIVSWVGELIFHVKWWNYSDMPLNLNGRVCLFYSIIWGILSLLLIYYLNPKIDKIIDFIKIKVNHKIIRIGVIFTVVFMLADWLISGQALSFFMARTIVNYDINVENKAEVEEMYNNIYSNEKLKNFIMKYWDDKMILQTFPRLKVDTKDGSVVYFRDVLTNIQPYYLKIWSGRKS